MIENPMNWAGNYTYRAVQLHRPETVEQIQELVARRDKIKVLGTRHFFNDSFSMMIRTANSATRF